MIYRERSADRHGDVTVKCRVIGETAVDRMVWGVELYWTPPTGGERYRRALGLTDDLPAVCRFCRQVNRGRVSPVHLSDILQDFCDTLAIQL